MRNQLLLLSALMGATGVAARDIPSNIQNFYNALKAQGDCKNKLGAGFYNDHSDTGAGSMYTSNNTSSYVSGPNHHFRFIAVDYCGDHLSDYRVIYLKGKGKNFADMDIDCDGEQNGIGDDGRCNFDKSYQPITSFQYIVKKYNKGINDLNAYVHPYVVFGNSGKKSGWNTFDPRAYGVEPLSIMAVVCNNKLVGLLNQLSPRYAQN